MMSQSSEAVIKGDREDFLSFFSSQLTFLLGAIGHCPHKLLSSNGTAHGGSFFRWSTDERPDFDSRSNAFVCLAFKLKSLSSLNFPF